MRTLIRGGVVVTAVDEFRADVLVDGERIVSVSLDEDLQADTTIDADGCFVFPGLVDSHTHLVKRTDPTDGPDFASGTAAAAAGGTTTVVDFAIQTDGSLMAGLRRWQEHGAGSHIDYGFHMIIDECSPLALDEMQDAVDAGVTSFKVFMSDSLVMSDEDVSSVLRRTAETGGLVQIHAENGPVIAANIAEALAKGDTSPKFHAAVRPPSAEAEATARAIRLAAAAERPIFVVHVSSAAALREIQEARVAGLPVYGETCVHYLLLTEDYLDQPGMGGADYVCSPPLRTVDDQDALWSGLRQRVLQNCTTDHCSHSHKGDGAEDFSQIENGLASIENRLALLHEFGVRAGRITRSELVNITSTSPADMFGLPQKGRVEPGCDADLVIFDPEATVTIAASTQKAAVDYNPYEGRTCRGSATTVLSRGEVIYRSGEVVSAAGRGRYLARDFGPFGPGPIAAI